MLTLPEYVPASYLLSSSLLTAPQLVSQFHGLFSFPSPPRPNFLISPLYRFLWKSQLCLERTGARI